MNREEYLQQLREQNGYCDCPQLRGLFEKRGRAQELEAKCDFYKQTVDLENPSEEDLQDIINYRDEVLNLQNAAIEYSHSLGECIQDKRVVLFLHKIGDLDGRKISDSEMTALLSRETDSVFSYRCARCNQQIDIRAMD